MKAKLFCGDLTVEYQEALDIPYLYETGKTYSGRKILKQVTYKGKKAYIILRKGEEVLMPEHTLQDCIYVIEATRNIDFDRWTRFNRENSIQCIPEEVSPPNMEKETGLECPAYGPYL